MSDFRDRMLNEHNELVERVNKLNAFLWGEIFLSLTDHDKQLLIEQLAHMKAYERVLAERISRS